MFENTDFAIYLMLLVGLFFGWLFAFVTYRRKIVAARKRARNELEYRVDKSYWQGWDEGWRAFVDCPILVKHVCNEYFHTHNP